MLKKTHSEEILKSVCLVLAPNQIRKKGRNMFKLLNNNRKEKCVVKIGA